MSVSAQAAVPNPGPPIKSPKSKPSRKSSEKDTSKEEKPDRLKTVVRRLPPNLPEDVFWQSVQTWVTDESVNWKTYYPGKLRKKLNKENIPSRAYIAFKSEDQLAQFSQGYDGHLFRDKAGNESIAVVEFAPYQKIPTEKKKADARGGTIEKDEDYLSFLESLKNGGAAKDGGKEGDLDSLIAATQPPPQPKTTPLLEALKAQKEKEAIIRAHAHYSHKEPPSVLKKHERDGKKDGEKKGGKVAKEGPAEAGPSKKAAKKAKAAAAAAQAQTKAGPSGSGAGGSAAPPAPIPAKQKHPRPPRPPPAGQPQVVNPASAVTPGGGESPAQRRPRPVIASRGFEAALSGAGVGRGQGRREKKEKEGGPGAAAGPDTVAGPSGGGEPTKKERERKRKEKEKDKEPGGSGAPGQSGAAAPSGGVLPAPTILSREGPPKIMARPAVAPDGGAAPAPSHVETGGGGEVRGGRGRGRGRGRGGRGRGGG